MDINSIPTSYQLGYERIRPSNPTLADLYAENTTIGDPLADAAIKGLSKVSGRESESFIRAGMDQNEDKFRDAPESLKIFFENVDTVPDWLDKDSLKVGCFGFHSNTDVLAITFMVGSIVEGFTTTIAKSFFITGRLVDFGVYRLSQNLRHLMDITIPGGLDRDADGWKTSVRIRLVHAKVRQHLNQWDGWDKAADGTPIHASNLALASALFSARCLEHGLSLGVRMSEEQIQGYMDIWRYVAYLFGVPDTLLFRNYEEAIELCRVGSACEPEPDLESIALTNGFLSSAPMLAGTTEREARREASKDLFKFSRALIGHERADKLNFPKYNTTGIKTFFKWKRKLSQKFKYSGASQADNFAALLDASKGNQLGLRYVLPPQLFSDERVKW